MWASPYAEKPLKAKKENKNTKMEASSKRFFLNDIL